MTRMWGIHNSTLTTELLEGSFVSLDWPELGDLRDLPPDRDGLKAALTAIYPDEKPRAVAAWAGVLLRFRDEIEIGDVVVAPYKPDSTINLGLVAGEYYYESAATEHRHRRAVVWKKVGIPRSVFTKPALYEVSAYLTVFRVRTHAPEFLAALEAADDSVDDLTSAVGAVVQAEPEESGTTDEPRASRIAQYTRDFVLERLLHALSHQEFEEFTADLLRAIGYRARVTSYTRDGGVDVIAHRDPLGVEPPLIKVQCKHLTSKVGAPDVSQLIGRLGQGELGLFVTLGNYSADALAIERSRPGLRLLTGDDVVSLVLDHYADLGTTWRARIPLTSLLVVDDAADE